MRRPSQLARLSGARPAAVLIHNTAISNVGSPPCSQTCTDGTIAGYYVTISAKRPILGHAVLDPGTSATLSSQAVVRINSGMPAMQSIMHRLIGRFCAVGKIGGQRRGRAGARGAPLSACSFSASSKSATRCGCRTRSIIRSPGRRAVPASRQRLYGKLLDGTYGSEPVRRHHPRVAFLL